MLDEGEKRTPQETNTKNSASQEPGARVLALRKKLGLTRSQFNKHTGISAHTLRAWEIGAIKLNPDKALTLSHMFILVFGLEPEEASVDAILTGARSKESLSRLAKIQPKFHNDQDNSQNKPNQKKLPSITSARRKNRL